MTATSHRHAALIPKADSALRTDATRPDFGALYTEHADFIWTVLRGMGVESAAVQDAVQDVFIVVHRRYVEFDHRHKLRTWLFEIAHRVAKVYRRRQAKARVLDDQTNQLPSDQRSPAEQFEQHETAQLVSTLFGKLDDAKRMTLVLAELEGLSVPEISELTGVPLNTVYTRLRRARIEFSQALAKHTRSQR